MQNVFAKRLYELRSRNSETQKDLADQFKVSRGMVSHWEQGRYYPEVSKAIEIAEYFNVSLDYLFGFTSKIQNTAPTLTTDEKEVIELYRSIGPHEREKVRTALEVYAEATELDQRSGNKNTRG